MQRLSVMSRVAINQSSGMSNKVLMINQYAVSSANQFAKLAAFKRLCSDYLQLFNQGSFHLFGFPLPNFFYLLIACLVQKSAFCSSNKIIYSPKVLW